MHRNHNTIHKWAWPGSRDVILGPLITFERIDQSASDLVQIWRTDPLLHREYKTTPKWAWPG